MALISVIIPCFNAEPWIRETLNSAITQGLDDIETIAIDDGSTDESANIIEKEFPNVHLIRTKNQGASKTRNLGTEMSKGDFIQYLDADDLLAPGKLKLQLEMLENSGADVAYGDWQKLVKAPGGIFVKGEIVSRKIKNPEIDLFADFWCPPAAYLFRRSIVEKIGGFNENLPVIQDARFALDCALYGAEFVYCEGIMAYYRVHSAASVSSKDPIGFVRDCLLNATEVEMWWQEHGGINEERKAALLKVYGYIYRESFKKDNLTYELAYKAINILSPGYVPTRSRILRLTYKLLGHKRAESLALWYRQLRSSLKK